jgi:hypothetical protein
MPSHDAHDILAHCRGDHFMMLRRQAGLFVLVACVAFTPITAQAFDLIELLTVLQALQIIKPLVPPALSGAFPYAGQPIAQRLQMTLTALSAAMPQASGAHSAAFSCPVFAGAGTLLGEDSCLWAQASGQWSSQSGVNDQRAIFHVGGQKEVTPGWFVGAALGGGPLWMQSGGTTGQGQGFDGSIALKHTIGPWLLAGAIGFDTTALHFQRTDGTGAMLQSDQSVVQGFVRLRGAYDFAFTDWYMRPRLDIEVDYTYMPGYQESGASPFAMAINSSTTTKLALTPTVEVGGRYDLSDTSILRPYLAGGAIILPDDTSTLVMSFVGPLGAARSFPISSSGPSALGTVEAGLQFYRVHGWETKVEYKLAAGDDYLSQAVSLRGAYHF